MFHVGDIVKVLIPNAVNAGYDYRLNAAATRGQMVRVTVMNRAYVGIIIGPGDGVIDVSKIKPVTEVLKYSLSNADVDWILKMAEWTMMAPGAVLRLILNVPDAFLPPRQEIMYTMGPIDGVRMTDARMAVADAFAANDNDSMTVSDIQHIARVSGAVVRTMIKNNLLVPAASRVANPLNISIYCDMGTVTLNADQSAAAAEIGRHIDAGGFSVHVLDGVTGSGKTQVYFDAAWRAYAAGHGVLLMMPEIALTAQFMDRFRDRFGAPPVVWHSNLTAARRRDIWRAVASGDVRIVVGTRSALFLPWQNLGLVVIDEEHDGSYKQEDMGNYHARDMAILRAKIGGFPVVLASATPSAETLENVACGRFHCMKLTSRFGGAQMPTIETIDMRGIKCQDYTPSDAPDTLRAGTLSPVLCDAMRDTLAAGHQVMLFINRRGFAPLVQCRHCGWVASCPDCTVSMTYHKRMGRLMCHMCGRTAPMTDVCPECGLGVTMRGAGLEKIQEEVAAKFPGVRTECVSSDTMLSRAALERLVARMESGAIDVVIGTQILAKGHHFPNLTLVGVVDADMGLFGTDFRAAEHTFQQLFQVAGRAGRGDTPGRVLMQTYQPTHPVMTAICAGARDEFMTTDMNARRTAGMPPYGQLIAIIVEGQRESVVQKFCSDLAAAAPNLNGGKIMGPIMAGVYQIRHWYRMRFLISGARTANLQPAVKHWLAKVRVPANVRVKIDVNPQNFM